MIHLLTKKAKNLSYLSLLYIKSILYLSLTCLLHCLFPCVPFMSDVIILEMCYWYFEYQMKIFDVLQRIY